MSDLAFQRCISPTCRATVDLAETAFRCPACGSLLDIGYEWDRLPVPKSLAHFESKWSNRSNPLDFSGVWRFRELFPFAPDDRVLTIGEGQTLCQRADSVAAYAGLNPGQLFLQYEGMNPSGSFKDNGMTAAFTHARMTGGTRAACASTGNTSASLAIYCAATQLMRAVIFIGSGKISYGKLSQALEHGALTIQIAGDFDDALRQVQEVSRKLGIYLVNSVNPFRLEGQKTIMYRDSGGASVGRPRLDRRARRQPRQRVELRQGLHRVAGTGPDRARRRDSRSSMPPGPTPFISSTNEHGLRWNGGQFDKPKLDAFMTAMDAANRRADTLASAIEINRPVNLPKALRALERCGGVVREATDQEILDAKARIGAGGLGCEPASAATVAGLRKLVQEGIIAKDETVACVLTGHVLKDPDATVAYHTADAATFDAKLGKRGVKRASFANRAVQVPNDLAEIVKAIELYA